MSFNFEFYAKQEDAVAIVDGQYAPEFVKSFLKQGLTAYKPESLVWVKANGHLYNNDYQRSNAELVVQEITFRVPKKD